MLSFTLNELRTFWGGKLLDKAHPFIESYDGKLRQAGEGDMRAEASA